MRWILCALHTTVRLLAWYILTFMRLLAADCCCTTPSYTSSYLIPFICILNVISFSFCHLLVFFWRGKEMALMMILYARCWQSWRNSNIFARHAIRWWRNGKAPPFHSKSVLVQFHQNIHGFHNRNFVNVSTLCKCAYILFIEPNAKQMIYEFNHRYALFLSESSQYKVCI